MRFLSLCEVVWRGERTCTFVLQRVSRSSLLWLVFPRTATIRSHKSSAVIPSNQPQSSASKEMISDSVELCETEVCLLHIQLIGTNGDRLFALCTLLSLTTGFSILSWVWIVFPRTDTIRSHKSRAIIPSDLNPASKEMISDSVELCETEVCLLHIQLIGTNLWLPKTHNVPPEVDFESSRSSAKSESWISPSLHCLAILHPHDNIVCIHMYDECKMINRFRRLSQALVHFRNRSCKFVHWP